MKYFVALLLSAFLFVACGDESSSSAPAPDPSEESSSSVEKSKSSSSEGKVASSSSKKDENSSSSVEKAKESSSSVKPSSSSEAKSSSSEETKTSSSSGVFDVNAPCTYGDVYVEEVDGEKRAYICYEDGWKRYIPKSSSSSVAKSSSSSSIRGYEALPYVPFNSSLSYGEFTDTRDGTKYATIDIDNKYGPDSVRLTFTVFAQNLKYHDKMVLGAEEQDDDTKVEMYCYNDSIEYCNDWWGGLYQWAELMDLPYDCNNKSCAELVDPDGDGFHQGICPDGWHVMTRKEMLAASYTTGGSKYLDDRMSTLASEISYANGLGSNTSGMSFLAAGYRNGEKKIFDFLSEVALVAFAEENALIVLNSRVGGVSNVTSLESTTPKIDGVSVRCVKDY